VSGYIVFSKKSILYNSEEVNDNNLLALVLLYRKTWYEIQRGFFFFFFNL
jgi:hypothetical protein